jgi:hypothetical protein
MPLQVADTKLLVQSEKLQRRIKDLNLMLTEMRYGHVVSLKTRVFDTVRRTLSGRGGSTDSHGRNRAFGCEFQLSADTRGREELNSPASVRPFLDDTDKTEKPRGLSPRYFAQEAIICNILQYT